MIARFLTAWAHVVLSGLTTEDMVALRADVIVILIREFKVEQLGNCRLQGSVVVRDGFAEGLWKGGAIPNNIQYILYPSLPQPARY